MTLRAMGASSSPSIVAGCKGNFDLSIIESCNI